MAQRNKIAQLISKAQTELEKASQENAPLWVGVELATVIHDLEKIKTQLFAGIK